LDGYTALHESAAWFDLSSRGKIRVTGEDRARLLHAMLTNDVQGLKPGQGNYHFLLNAQGRILADVNLYVFPDHVLLDCEPPSREKIYRHLDHYIIADDVQLEDVTASLATVALEGPRALELAGVAVPDADNAHTEVEGMTVARASASGQPGLWFFLEPSRKAGWIARLEEAGATAASEQDVRVVRVENGRPQYGEDFGEANLPQETQQMRALHFTKGCYLGQEIVERIRSRGQVHRLLVKLDIEGAEPPAAGAAVQAGGQEAGKISSPVYSPRRGCVAALAIVRREHATAGKELTVEGRPARVR
jgi:folate-binding protein YgfZ